MFYPSILYIKIIFNTHENNILSQIPANIQTPNSMALPPTNQQPPLLPPPTTHQPPQTTPTITKSSNKFQIQKPQQNFKKIKINKKQTQNLQQNPNPTGQSMTKLNQPSAARLVTAPG